jgi:hypothetical protein
MEIVMPNYLDTSNWVHNPSFLFFSLLVFCQAPPQCDKSSFVTRGTQVGNPIRQIKTIVGLLH